MITDSILAQNEMLFTTIGKLSNDGFFVFDFRTTSFSYLNEKFGAILGLSNEELYDHPATLIHQIHPEDRSHVRFCLEECRADLIQKKYEIRLLIGNEERYIRCTVFPFKGEQKDCLCGWIEDTTIDKRNKLLIEQINARKNATLEVLSHDLKEPMGLMRLAASTIQDDIQDLGNPRLVETLQFISTMCDRNIKLVRSIVNHEFLKSAIVELNKERVDIVSELQDLIRTYRKSHLRELKDFRFESSSDTIFLLLDTMKFTQVINNLISNSLKFTAKGGIIALEVKEQADQVIVSLSDNGIGIPDELKVNLFKGGKQALRRGLLGEESGGLGMNIIKSIVDLHDGEIWYESQEGVGTTFYIALPK